MALTVPCTCGKTYQVDESLAGKRVKCKACGAALVVPQKPAAQSAPVPASDDDEFRLAPVDFPRRASETRPAATHMAQPNRAASKSSLLLQKAAQAFGPFPPEVTVLGEPISVHPPSAAARLGARVGVRLEGIRQWLGDPAEERKRAAGMAIVMPVIGLGFLAPYLIGFEIGGAPPEVWLIFTAVGLVFGLFGGGYWWYLSRTAASAPAPPQPEAGGSLPGFILYPDAIVHVCGGKFTVIRWDDVETLDSAVEAAYWRVTARDGRQIQLSFWVEDEATTIETTVSRVSAVLVPQYVQRIEAGDKIMFGPFGVSKYCVFYKNKKADWIEVTSMRILTGKLYCLQIFCGGFLPWCNFDILHAPNGQLVYELLRRVAPPRLLVPE